jgi:hypothetical protein
MSSLEEVRESLAECSCFDLAHRNENVEEAHEHELMKGLDMECAETHVSMMTKEMPEPFDFGFDRFVAGHPLMEQGCLTYIDQS